MIESTQITPYTHKSIQYPIGYMYGMEYDKTAKNIADFFIGGDVIVEVNYPGKLFQLYIDKNKTEISTNEIWYKEWPEYIKQMLLSSIEGEHNNGSIFIGIAVGYHDINIVDDLDDAITLKPFMLDCIMYNGKNMIYDSITIRKSFVSASFRDYKSYYATCKGFEDFNRLMPYTTKRNFIFKKANSKYIEGECSDWLLYEI